MVTDELASRYGRPPSAGQRRVYVAVLAAVLVIALGWAAWFALTTGSPSLTWQNLSYRTTATGVDVEFEVTFDGSAGPAATAICTVQALNGVRSEVGRRDVRAGPLGPSGYRTLRIKTTVPTSEPAVTGLVTECVPGGQ